MQNTTLQNVTRPVQETARQIQQWDAQREGVPGEHWLALGAGLWLFMATRRSPSLLVQVGGAAVASLLVVRAATGRDGLARKSWLPL